MSQIRTFEFVFFFFQQSKTPKKEYDEIEGEPNINFTYENESNVCNLKPKPLQTDQPKCSWTNLSQICRLQLLTVAVRSRHMKEIDLTEFGERTRRFGNLFFAFNIGN